jgi:hypothetical protein
LGTTFAFATFVHYRYRSELIDTFAVPGLRNEHQPSNAIVQFRKLLKRERTLYARGCIIPSDRLTLPSGAGASLGARFAGGRHGRMAGTQ